MDLLVKIDDNLYTRLFDNGIDNVEDLFDAAKAIRKGTPCQDAINKEALLDATVRKNSVWNAITDSEGRNLEEIINSLRGFKE